MGKRTFRLVSVSIALLAFVFGGALALWAQEDAGGEDAFMLEEVTVTAEKREANLQKVPISMEAISGESLALEGKRNVDAILRDISNVSIFTGEEGLRISIRGITDNGSYGDGLKESASMVGVNLDGVQNSESSAGQNLFDIERVEVLYGPQSTLYGSNSPGGIVNIVTASPKLDKYSASVNANYGSYDSWNLQAVLNAPVLKEKVALRLAASKSSQDSWMEDSEGSRNTSARLKILWQVYEDLSITVTPSWSKASSGGMMGDSVKTFDYQDGTWWTATGGGPDPITWTNEGKVTDPWTATDTQAGPGGGGNTSDRITKAVSSDISWNTPVGSVAFVPSFSKDSSEGTMTNNDGYAFDTDDYTEQTGVELRVTNPEAFTLFEWIVGGTYNKSEQGKDKISLEPENADSEYNYVTSKKTALYANVTYPLWFYEDLALTLGYRYSWDKMDSLFTSVPPWATDGSVQEDTKSYDLSKPDYKYGFTWDAADQMMVYGSYASSYRSVNAKATEDQANEPESLKSYTLGAKTRVFNNRLQINGSIYFYDYTNKYEQSEGESAYVLLADWIDEYPELAEKEVSEDGYVYVDDHGWPISGDFESFGIDLSASWIVTSNSRLNFSISHLDAKWYSLTKPAGENYPLIFPEKSYKNISNFNSPEWSMTAGYDHSFQIAHFGALTPSLDIQYKSSTWLTYNHDEIDPHGVSFQEDYYLLNGSATFNSAGGNWSVNASVDNILDYAVKRSYFSQGSGSLRIGDPRTYQVGFSLKF